MIWAQQSKMNQNNNIGIANIEIQDSIFKTEVYITKILKATGSMGQIEKICHLAAENCIKHSENNELNETICRALKKLIAQTRNYFLLYLLDILLKNSLIVMKLCRNDLVELFKAVWEQTCQQNKNTVKIQCLKAMARTWNIIYSGYKIQQTLENWLKENYGTNLNLQKKNEELLAQAYERYRPNVPSSSTKIENQLSKSDSEKRSVISNANKVGPFEIRLFRKPQQKTF